MKNKNNKGFTLIELLVVIAIISLLSAVVLSNLRTARSKAIDTGTIAQVDQIKKAIAMFYSENGRYPQPSNPNLPSCLSGLGTCKFMGSPVDQYLTNEFLTIIEKEEETKFTLKNLIPKALAITNVGTYIKFKKIETNSIIYQNQEYKGIIYLCQNSCNEAYIYWPVKSGTVTPTQNGLIKYQNANGTGGINNSSANLIN